MNKHKCMDLKSVAISGEMRGGLDQGEGLKERKDTLLGRKAGVPSDFQGAIWGEGSACVSSATPVSAEISAYGFSGNMGGEIFARESMMERLDRPSDAVVGEHPAKEGRGRDD